MSSSIKRCEGVSVTHLNDMTRGWFVGNFKPAAYRVEEIEVAVQHFTAGAFEPEHIHKVATEVTLLLSGKAVMAGILMVSGDILTLEPGTKSSFEALEDCTTVVVKHPGTLNDKYLVNEEC